MLRIEKVIYPDDFVALRIDQAIGTSASLSERLMGQDQFHNCCARSRQSVKSAAVAPATK